ncbi:hypothetical protein BCV70DRAFT_198593 [Testicularia cyperi]|uniref:Uncharacterized protein n=1 Tax=Testicularia cyperi TaxID=1882483 RepID=A0A317XY80_9BASI|nr:hypothetical protein BCV70DRAFT_198593 [Testicularia cyperi]
MITGEASNFWTWTPERSDFCALFDIDGECSVDEANNDLVCSAMDDKKLADFTRRKKSGTTAARFWFNGEYQPVVLP